MKAEHGTHTLSLVVLCILLIVTAGVMIGTKGGSETGFRSFHGSSYNPGALGTKAFFLSLRRLGWESRRLLKPSFPDSEGGLLLIVGPILETPDLTTTRRLFDWVSKGNTLLYFAPSARHLGGAFNDILFMRKLKFIVRLPFINVNLPEKNGHPLSWREWRQLILKGRKTGVTGERGYTTGASPIVLDAPSSLLPFSRGWKAAVRSKHGEPILIERKQGDGRIIAVSSAAIISNRFLRHGKNLQFVMNILKRRCPARKVLFDEYHHGFRAGAARHGGRIPKPLLALLSQLALWSLVFIVSAARRQGPAIEPLPAASPTKLDFAVSLAHLYERTDTKSFALENLLSELAEKSGMRVRGKLHPEQLAASVSELISSDREKVLSLLRQAVQALDGRRISTYRFVRLASELTRLLKRIKG